MADVPWLTAWNKNQNAKLEFDLESLFANFEKLRDFTDEELNKVLDAGAAAYASSAARHTPPNPGRKQIDPRKYADGYPVNRFGQRVLLDGLRPVYDLTLMVRHLRRVAGTKKENTSSKGAFKEIGQKLREGYRYAVKIRGGAWKFCRNEEEAASLAHEGYRGLTRAAWGLGFPKAGQKVPATIREMVGKRPKLGQVSGLFNVIKDRARYHVSIMNNVVEDRWFAMIDTNASLTSVRTMNDMIGRILKNRTVQL